jgi:processive 1,2-diacylglycerol beta-glucosyltransferase
MLNRILILSASSGAGHVRAGQAIAKAFAQSNIAAEVRHVDALEYCSPALRRIYSRGYIDMVNHAPTVLGILYDTADKPWKDENSRMAFDRLNTLPLAKFIKSFGADLVICTHFLPAEITSWLLCKKRIAARHAVVVTDFDAHSMWLCRHFDQYFVALDETKEHLFQEGVPKQRVLVSGIPIDPDFAKPKNKLEMRQKYDIHPELPTILLSAGGFGVGPVELLLQSLKQLKHPAQVIALCGKNAELKNRLEKERENTANGSLIIKPVGYTDKIDEYMAASDILLGKPGGLTTAEAISKGLAMVIVNPIPGQEERNSDHLLEQGIAIRCNNLPTLAYKIDKLLDEPARLKDMRENAIQLSNPNAAVDIVRTLIECKEAPAINFTGDHQCESGMKRLATNSARRFKTVRKLAARQRKRRRDN